MYRDFAVKIFYNFLTTNDKNRLVLKLRQHLYLITYIFTKFTHLNKKEKKTLKNDTQSGIKIYYTS